MIICHKDSRTLSITRNFDFIFWCPFAPLDPGGKINETIKYFFRLLQDLENLKISVIYGSYQVVFSCNIDRYYLPCIT